MSTFISLILPVPPLPFKFPPQSFNLFSLVLIVFISTLHMLQPITLQLSNWIKTTMTFPVPVPGLQSVATRIHPPSEVGAHDLQPREQLCRTFSILFHFSYGCTKSSPPLRRFLPFIHKENLIISQKVSPLSCSKTTNHIKTLPMFACNHAHVLVFLPEKSWREKPFCSKAVHPHIVYSVIIKMLSNY